MTTICGGFPKGAATLGAYTGVGSFPLYTSIHSPSTLLYSIHSPFSLLYTPPFNFNCTLQNVRCCMCWVLPFTIQNVQYTHKHRLGHCTNIHRDSWSLFTVHSVLLDTGHMLDTFKYRMYLCHKYNGRCTYSQG